MFRTVLIAEDHESANISVQTTLRGLGITGVEYAYYCDDALTRINKRKAEGDPFDLLITDLSFDADGRTQVLKGGEALIRAARLVQPGLKVLVFSLEHKVAVIAGLFDELGIDGYVRKARRDAQELRAALEAVAKNKRHFPVELRQELRQPNAHDFTAYDIVVISSLSRGMLQKDIPAYLQHESIAPSGLSSVEKRLNLIKYALGFSKNEQLVAYCKDKGII